jgi:hypothetical protein
MPAGHGALGKSGVSAPLVKMVCRQVYRKPTFLVAWSLLLVNGLPTVMRNPFDGQLRRHEAGKASSYRFERCDLIFTIPVEVQLRVVNRHSLGSALELSICILRNTLIHSISSLEVQNSSPVVREIPII